MWTATSGNYYINYLTKDFLVGIYRDYSERCIAYNRNANDNTPPPSDDPEIVGEWVSGSYTYVYNADGTFSYTYNDKTGKYFTNNNVLFRLYDGGSRSSDEYKIDGDKLTIGSSTYNRK